MFCAGRSPNLIDTIDDDQYPLWLFALDQVQDEIDEGRPAAGTDYLRYVAAGVADIVSTNDYGRPGIDEMAAHHLSFDFGLSRSTASHKSNVLGGEEVHDTSNEVISGKFRERTAISLDIRQVLCAGASKNGNIVGVSSGLEKRRQVARGEPRSEAISINGRQCRAGDIRVLGYQLPERVSDGETISRARVDSRKRHIDMGTDIRNRPDLDQPQAWADGAPIDAYRIKTEDESKSFQGRARRDSSLVPPKPAAKAPHWIRQAREHENYDLCSIGGAQLAPGLIECITAR
jgi:hypothetical protein